MKDWIASIAVSIVALATVIGIIWKFASWKMGVDKDIGSLGKGTDEDRSTIKSFMKEIRNDIKDIFKRLPPPPAVTGQSPIRLTDHGEELAADLQAKAWAKELAPSIVDEVRGKRPFEIDEFCNTYVTTRLPGEWVVKVAECAYRFGTARENVLPVLGVVLRDELFSLLGIEAAS